MGTENLFRITFIVKSDGGFQEYIYLVIEDGDKFQNAIAKAETRFHSEDNHEYWDKIIIECVEGDVIK